MGAHLEGAGALRGRGIGEPAASLTAEVAIAVLRIAFEPSVGDPTQRDLQQLIRAAFQELKAANSEELRSLTASKNADHGRLVSRSDARRCRWQGDCCKVLADPR